MKATYLARWTSKSFEITMKFRYPVTVDIITKCLTIYFATLCPMYLLTNILDQINADPKENWYRLA
jgi:hypothetical protein